MFSRPYVIMFIRFSLHAHKSPLQTSQLRTHRYLSTNYFTIEFKDRSISAIITERHWQRQLDSVSHEISGLNAVMDRIDHLHQQVVEKKDMITQPINFHGGLGSTRCCLPTEVLSHIFVLCLPEDNYLSPASNLAPMLLTRICRLWREVALSLPGLWCRLRLGAESEDWERKSFCYELWLKRSIGRPLFLALQCSEIDSTRRARSLLQPYVDQISSLSFHSSFEASQLIFLLNDLPALQELSIVTMNLRALVECISRLPSTLTSFKLTGSWASLRLLPSSNHTWAHLTNIVIKILSNAVFHLLELCPNLCSLTIGILFDGVLDVEPFTHTKLQSLRLAPYCLGVQGPSELSDLLNAISLPNLHMLEVCGAQPWPHQELQALLTRSNCPLETLILGVGVTMTDDQRAEYLALIPSLHVVVDLNRPDFFAI
ncbi:hypothetical protein DEU56DRAFT_795276 [Suillus clintonianus]|uniref:uncharacterized protein n=1 Tax=Suillus clintonianus TaxID=1904413 RepID=UPI001B86D1A1|nr:uncharacterized protein DEU56DRAFT_795276 [Suillus clintonianus]KAG2141872.1 hypothetical protein DEU56DRAFT_795276 [Suillus clintonianus]